MKKGMLLAIITALVVVFNAPAGQCQTTVLKAVTAFPKNHPNNEPVPIFIDDVGKASQGKLKIEWLGGPEIFAAFDQIHAVKTGAIDMILYYPFGYMKSLMPEAEAKGLSQLPEWEERKTGAFELWTEIFEKRVNAKYLGRFHNNITFQVYSNKPFQKIDDFKGTNIRTMPLYIPFMKALGANPITIPPTEIYTSMERGVVHGYMWPRWGITGFGLQEVTKFMIEPGVFQMEPATMVNMDRWKKLPKDIQDLLLQKMKEHEIIAEKQAITSMAEEWKKMEKAGMKILKLLPEEGEKFYKLAYDMTWEQVIKAAPDYGPKLKKASSKKP
ncbi:MAG: TRAP transporter substrate-binding protein DctP [Thermodesulfobacteriota bacterium]